MMVNVSSIYWIDIDPYWDQFDPIPPKVHLAYGYITLIIAIVACITNAVVASFYSRFSLSPVRVYIVSLAVSDALSPAITYWMILKSSYYGVWQFNQSSCTMYGFIQGYLSLVSMTTLAAVSLESCIRIKKDVHSGRPKLQFGIVILLWGCSAAAVAPPLFGWGRYTPEGFLTSCCFDFIRRDWKTRSFVIYLFTSGFAVPMLIICCSYICTLMFVKQGHSNIHMVVDAPLTNRSSDGQGADYWEAEHRMLDNESLSGLADDEVRSRNARSACIMFIVVIFFVISWTPYAILALIGQFGPVNTIGPYSVAVAGLLAKASVMINPFIYLTMDCRFRKLIIEKFCFFCFRDRPYMDIYERVYV